MRILSVKGTESCPTVPGALNSLCSPLPPPPKLGCETGLERSPAASHLFTKHLYSTSVATHSQPEILSASAF